MSSPQWRFADFRLDPANACLWRGTQPIALTPKAFDVLHYLVTHPDRLVTKDTLLDAVWPELAISDAVMRVAIGELRRALGDTAQAPRFIATVHRRGYRFVAPVTEHTEEVPGPASPAPPARSPRTAAAPPENRPARLARAFRNTHSPKGAWSSPGENRRRPFPGCVPQSYAAHFAVNPKLECRHRLQLGRSRRCRFADVCK